jgi:uncharacterized protein
MSARTFRLLALSVWLLALAAAVGAQELRRAGFVGVRAGALTQEARARLHFEGDGVLVLALVDGGSAKDAGLQPDDIITQVNEHKVASTDDFVSTVTRLRAGDAVTIRFVRGGAAQTKQLVLKPRPFEASPDADTLYKSVEVDGTLRRAIVTAPKGLGKHPAVLYITGVGCFSQESLGLASTEAKLLYGLTRAGFVTMRVEKSGTGDSDGPPCASPAVDMRAEVRGYVAGLKALESYPFVDAGRVFIVGLSIGGVEAPLVAQQMPAKGLVVINTVAKPFLEYLADTRRRQSLLRRTPYDEMERRLRLNEQCNHRLLVERETPEQLLKEIPSCADFVEYPAPYTYMQQWAALNLAEEWKRVDAPVLVLYGTSDYISTVADDPYLADLINSFHPGRATLKAVPGMDHYLTKAASMEESMKRTTGIYGEFEPAVLDAVREWLTQQSR